MRPPAAPLPVARAAPFAVALAAGLGAQEPGGVTIDPGAALKAVIDRGHAWLRRHQDEDGRWSASTFCVHDPKGAPCDGPGKPDQDVFVTSLVVEACYGIGQLPSDPQHEHLIRATTWLQTQVQPDGSIGTPSSRTLVRDTASASDALACAHRYGHPADVGADLSTTLSWLDAHCGEHGLWPANDGGPDWVATAHALKFLTQQDNRAPAAVLPGLIALDGQQCRGGHAAAIYVAAWFVRDPELRSRTCATVAARWRELAEPERDREPLLWFWATQGMQFEPAETWTPWWNAVVTAATASQRNDGAYDGSWDPTGPLGRECGRVYATAATLLALEVIWRKQYRDK